MRDSTSRNQANGSTPVRLQEAMKLRSTAAVLPPPSLFVALRRRRSARAQSLSRSLIGALSGGHGTRFMKSRTELLQPVSAPGGDEGLASVTHDQVPPKQAPCYASGFLARLRGDSRSLGEVSRNWRRWRPIR